MPEAIKPIVADFLPQIPIISYNGAFIQDEKWKALASSPMQKTEGLAICDLVETSYPELAWNVYSADRWLSQSRQNQWILREEEVVGITSQEANEEVLEGLSEIHKLLIMGEPEQILDLEETLLARYPDLSIAKSYPYYLEIMAKGIQKGRAVEKLAQHYGIAMDDTIAFGDNFNDLDKLKAVGQGYVHG